MHTVYRTYTGAQAHQEGGGFLGFRQITETDGATGLTTVTSFQQDYPHHGLPILTEQYSSSGALVGHSETVWSYLTNTNYGPTYHFAYPSWSLEDKYELDGSLIARTSTEKQYDDHGNATHINVTSQDGYIKDTINTYTDTIDSSKWLLGRLTRSTVTASYSPENGSSLQSYPMSSVEPVCVGDNLASLGTVSNPGPDSDGDGMPDSWETLYGLSPTSSTDGTKDLDGDGLTNLAEYQNKTNPTLTDTDGDGVNDATEVSLGSSPLVNEGALGAIINYILSD